MWTVILLILIVILQATKSQDLEIGGKKMIDVDGDRKDEAARMAYVRRGLEMALDKTKEADLADASRKSQVEVKNEPV